MKRNWSSKDSYSAFKYQQNVYNLERRVDFFYIVSPITAAARAIFYFILTTLLQGRSQKNIFVVGGQVTSNR